MDLNLKGKKALVCAASRGLGRACAEALAAEGCELFICSRNQESIDRVANDLRERFAVKVQTMAIDLSTSGAVEKLHEAASKSLGQIDVLINNIGGPPPSSAVETTDEQWRSGFEQVFLSSTRLTQLCVPKMCESKFGRILTITSLSVVEPIDRLVVSTAMRSAATAFCKTLSKEVASEGVTVNTVMPGVIHTERIEQLRQDKADRLGTTLEAEIQKTEASIPKGRLGKPEELAHLVTFLSSPLSGYITGMNFAVDGGLRKGGW
ncbi:SDR family oxidoreductase [Oligoflexaceae bacterium]|nr:SDR family oxidoreductase [Oligoflexaceae bacterium]